jgi:hypothetical protein
MTLRPRWPIGLSSLASPLSVRPTRPSWPSWPTPPSSSTSGLQAATAAGPGAVALCTPCHSSAPEGAEPSYLPTAYPSSPGAAIPSSPLLITQDIKWLHLMPVGCLLRPLASSPRHYERSPEPQPFPPQHLAPFSSAFPCP